ncbi:PQQ-binding-like beta-propeller repeat protein [Actinomadura violacea]|uniref:PQQ-binding-like beta-propeller repeat protein n=1 Tax=Actinomadura violacea TaxID=2819934 RepID=A0ABS3RTN0_9ACTN|nr:PQQ-binding-like beta-propeller repeat protein [Actinomadura violacea]MBO2460092.1 PQQ-binding-like beta-propeller repeat protein [Actinomadura violacea]
MRAGVGAAAALSLVGAALVQPGSAAADTMPAAGVPATVSADPLPTAQVNGVVWSMATVGSTVYATGNFTKARPAGVKEGGAGEVARGNIMAFDLATGKLSTSFVHTLDGQGLRLMASPDGKRVYVGGDFTKVDGKDHNHLAAFDTATGKLIDSFAPNVKNRVRAIAATDSTVYVGGNFFNVNGKSRTRLAAVKASDGSNIDTWKPAANDDEVYALAVYGDRVIVGGRFQQLNGEKRVGIGAVSATNGGTLPWSSKPIPTKATEPDSAGKYGYSYVTDLRIQNGIVYGAADGERYHWFDGRFAAKASDGALVWLDNCYGATYGILPVGQTVYAVGHPHDCTSLGAFPETTPETYHRTIAETFDARGTDKAKPGTNSNYSGQPIPQLLDWFPKLGMGTFTKQYQAAWAITGNSSYVAMGGEFPNVNGKAQAGLVRFTVKANAANKVGPDAASVKAPTVTKTSTGLKVSWAGTWDMDNGWLHYEVLRDSSTTALTSVKRLSKFWDEPSMTFTDTKAARGKHTYRIRVKDPLGNTVTGPASAAVTW